MEDKHTDYEDYWNELHTHQKESRNLDEFLDQECIKQIKEEGEQETDWLRDVGLDHLTDAYHQGREIGDSEVNASVSLLSKHQADAVKRRVRSLNQTVRNRYRQQRTRHRKPDIRDVFRDFETSSTGTRSRSATPDSLDSAEEEDDGRVVTRDTGGVGTTVVTDGVNQEAGTSGCAVLPGHELFGRPGHWSMHRVDVASDSEGIELLGYQRIGTMHGPVWDNRVRSGSVPTVTLSALDLQTGVPVPRPAGSNSNQQPMSHSHENPWCPPQPVPVSFENSFFQTRYNQPATVCITSGHEMLQVSDTDLRLLKPLLWLELSSIFDKHSVTLEKRTPYKRKRKESGNVFGVSLSSLVMRDRRICVDNSTVPQVFQMILGQLERRCCNEEGILRIAGQKQKVETICSQVESHFYTKPQHIKDIIEKTTCHELTSLLKRLLRELPQPLLTTELIDLFYKSYELSANGDLDSQCRALNLLVLLLPIEHSGTLRILISFLDSVIKNETVNKMSLHNVAMIIAPSLFPPRHMFPMPAPCSDSLAQDNLNAQVKMAAVCCRLVEVLLQCGLDLWKIPSTLWLQLRNLQKQPTRKKEPLRRSNTHYDSSSSGSNRQFQDFPVVSIS